MTLKERFKNIDDEGKTWDEIYDSEVQLADDYAIEFAEWYKVKCILSSLDFHLTTKELLEIFKKEKGL